MNISKREREREIRKLKSRGAIVVQLMPGY